MEVLHVVQPLPCSPMPPPTAPLEKLYLCCIKNTPKAHNFRKPYNHSKWPTPSEPNVLAEQGIIQLRGAARWCLTPTQGHSPSALATARKGIWSMTVLRRTGPLWVRRGLFHTTRFTPDLLMTLKITRKEQGLYKKELEMKACFNGIWIIKYANTESVMTAPSVRCTAQYFKTPGTACIASFHIKINGKARDEGQKKRESKRMKTWKKLCLAATARCKSIFLIYQQKKQKTNCFP